MGGRASRPPHPTPPRHAPEIPDGRCRRNPPTGRGAGEGGCCAARQNNCRKLSRHHAPFSGARRGRSTGGLELEKSAGTGPARKRSYPEPSLSRVLGRGRHPLAGLARHSRARLPHRHPNIRKDQCSRHRQLISAYSTCRNGGTLPHCLSGLCDPVRLRNGNQSALCKLSLRTNPSSKVSHLAVSFFPPFPSKPVHRFSASRHLHERDSQVPRLPA